MDTLTFWSEIVDSLAWPGIIFLLALIFRRPLIELILSLESIETKSFKTRFKQGVKRVATSVTALATKPSATLPPGRMLELAKKFPREAVLNSYHTVVQASLEAVERSGIRLSPSPSPSTLARTLEEAHILDHEKASIVRELGELRDNLADQPPKTTVPPTTAAQYVDAATIMASIIIPEDSPFQVDVGESDE